jgi:hypothetical protein
MPRRRAVAQQQDLPSGRQPIVGDALLHFGRTCLPDGSEAVPLGLFNPFGRVNDRHHETSHKLTSYD